MSSLVVCYFGVCVCVCRFPEPESLIEVTLVGAVWCVAAKPRVRPLTLTLQAAPTSAALGWTTRLDTCWGNSKPTSAKLLIIHQEHRILHSRFIR